MSIVVTGKMSVCADPRKTPQAVPYPQRARALNRCCPRSSRSWRPATFPAASAGVVLEPRPLAFAQSCWRRS